MPKQENSSAVSKLIKSMAWGASKRSLLWDLSKSEAKYLLKLPCNYCGISPSSKYTRKKTKKYKDTKYVYEVSCTYNGIDRIDNTVGYTVSNCVTCCWICTRAKANMTLDEFKSWVIRCYKYLSRKKLRRP